MSWSRFTIKSVGKLNLDNQEIDSSGAGAMTVDNVAIGGTNVASVTTSPYNVTALQSGTTFVIKNGVNIILPAPTVGVMEFKFIFGAGTVIRFSM